MMVTVHTTQGATLKVRKEIFEAYVAHDRRTADNPRPGVARLLIYATDESGKVIHGSPPAKDETPAKATKPAKDDKPKEGGE
jgi:hypothetical protein